MGARSYLIVSDLHLMDVEEHADGWKHYKSADYHIDDELEALVGEWIAEAPDDAELTLVLNGDIFDFDLVAGVPEDPPFPVSRAERRHGLDSTAAKSVHKLERMVADHPLFIGMLARLRAAGHGVVYTFGNHDRELHFESVKDVLRRAVVDAAEALGCELHPSDAIQFEPWFYLVPGELYAEHGNQYDRYSSFRYVLSPTFRDEEGEEQIAVPMGDLSCRYLLNRMGFFNPHAEDFVLSVFAYLAHWARHYALKGRSLIRAWVWGSLLVTLRSLKTRRLVSKSGPDEHVARRCALAARHHLPESTLESIDAGKSGPVTLYPFRLIRELWLDRLVIAIAMTGGTVALALTPIPLWIQLMVPLAVFPLLFLLYEAVAQESIFSDYAMLPERAQQIAALTGAKVVALGHTHDPMMVPLARGRSFVNTGTWAPTDIGAAEQIVTGKRNFARVTVVDNVFDVRLDSYTEVPALEPEAAAEVIGEVVVERGGVGAAGATGHAQVAMES